MIQETKYGRDFRFSAQFGFGSTRTINSAPKNNVELFREALRNGWYNGCPNPEDYINENGADYAIRRYIDTNQRFSEAVRLAQALNTGVYYLLTTPRMRWPDEPVGKHDDRYVPTMHKFRIAPMCQEGYQVSRLLANVAHDSSREKLLRDALLETQEFPWHFVATLADFSLQNRVPLDKILSHLYPQSLFEEENCYTAYSKLIVSLEEVSPSIHRELLIAAADEKSRKELKIATVPPSLDS